MTNIFTCKQPVKSTKILSLYPEHMNKYHELLSYEYQCFLRITHLTWKKNFIKFKTWDIK